MGCIRVKREKKLDENALEFRDSERRIMRTIMPKKANFWYDGEALVYGEEQYAPMTVISSTTSYLIVVYFVDVFAS
jgi:hypothetical protein